MARFVNH